MPANHPTSIMPTALSDLEAELSAISEHPLFGKVQTIGALRIFMEHHVFAVWDFMSLVKALQAGLAPAHWPWRPQKHPELVRLINEILLAEECDRLQIRGADSPWPRRIRVAQGLRRFFRVHSNRHTIKPQTVVHERHRFH